METFKVLTWDSKFFGFSVAQICPPRLGSESLVHILQELKSIGVTLAYWPSDPYDEESQLAARGLHAFLADQKVTYLTELGDMTAPALCATGLELSVDLYSEMEACPELIQLGLQAGIFSRFRMDPHIPENKFIELYTLWITRSVRKEIAEAVYVIRNNGLVAGMVTVGEKKGRADIGLIAVDPSLRGRNAGTALVIAAQDWGLAQGYTQAQVVTQNNNDAACHLYKKCGYTVEKLENIYHFWINHENPL